MFRPDRENARSFDLTLFLEDSDPKTIAKRILSLIRTPFKIYVDFWCIGKSKTGFLLVQPSYGTPINPKILMKTDDDVQNLIDHVLDHKRADLRTMIFDAHAKTRQTVLESGVCITKIISIWMRVSKNSF